MNYSEYVERLNIQHPQFKEELNDIFSLYYSQRDFLSIEQKLEVRNIVANTKKIVQDLKPLRKLGIDYSLYLVGGAVRDFIVNKPQSINDYDFVLSVEPDSKHNKQIQLDNIKDYFTEQEFSDLSTQAENTKLSNDLRSLSNARYNYLVSNKLIEKTIKNANKQYKFYNLKNIAGIQDKSINYMVINDSIESMFKVTGFEDRKIDIIISKYDGFHYIRTFDFEICKGAIDLGFIKDNRYYTSEIDEIFKNMWLMPGMLRDLNDKTLSIQAGRFDQEHIEYFLTKHYPKLQEKFPHYKINCIKTDTAHHTSSETWVGRYALQLELQQNLPIHDKMEPLKKLKI